MIVLPYTTLLFDIDDTILDFQASEKRALEKLFMHLNRPLTSEIADYYRQLNATLWQHYEKGNVTRNQLLNSRFTLLFRHFGEDIDGASIEKQYRSFLAEGHDQILGANTYGLDSVWFNPAHLHNSTPAEPTFEIDSLTTLKTIVN